MSVFAPLIKNTKIFFAKPTPAKLLIFGFLALIALGTLLLSLPISAKSGHSTNFVDSLFTAASAVCVTGLVVVDTNTYWSVFGQIIILLLIQIGALGIMSVVTLFAVFTGKQLGLTQRLAIRDSISHYSLDNIVNTFRRILEVTLVVEGAGAILIATVLVPRYGWAGGVWRSVFQAVSSFCNAGFDLYGTADNPYSSLTAFSSNPLMLLVTGFLIVFGGLGFMVWHDVVSNRKFARFSLHTKIVVIMTVILILGGSIGYFLIERSQVLSGMTFSNQIINSFFSSITARTAGFNAIPMAKMSDASNMLTILLMFIGAAPGSTGGGIKITTVFVLAASVLTFMKGRNDVQSFKWRIPMEVISKATAIFFIGCTIVISSAFVLMECGEGTFMQSIFETTSAFGTVGLSLGITSGLQLSGKLMLTLVMFLGRVGPITAIMAFTAAQVKTTTNYRYPEGKITVG